MVFAINDNFLELLDLVDKDGNYNYLAYLLADNNRIPICVGTFKGTDKMDLIEYEDYGNCSLVKACKMVIEKFMLKEKKQINLMKNWLEKQLLMLLFIMNG